MRIVGGEWRGLGLAEVGKGDPQSHLRPTSDRVRESLFNILEHGAYRGALDGARVLDLFAGTGALGLEALSRGAERAMFVDQGRAAQKILSDNIARTRADARAVVLRADATRLPQNTYPPATVIFLDPPYGKGLGARALASATAQGWLAPDSLIIWEDAAPQTAPQGYSLTEHRRFGGTHITFLNAISR
ncbi:MAG: 16S rRNA (guanine(966)-N(2))-methyltransferase RsmD [Pseudomonadota bacterium]